MLTFDLKNLNVEIEHQPILTDINFSLKQGEILYITGENGSGKTTLLKSIMNHFSTKITSGEVILNSQTINNYTTDKIANSGVFYISQTPVELPGVSTLSLLKLINENRENKKFSELFNTIQTNLELFKIPEELLSRDLNVGFSGGQKKKVEFLQASVFNPQVLLLDEVEAGLDVDAIKTIVQFINSVYKKMIIIIISHNLNFVNQLNIKKTIVLANKKIVKEGKKDLIKTIEEKGLRTFDKTSSPTHKVVLEKCRIKK
ncbi:MAG: ATP-binding cassette domain-containing protein [Mycoplasmataceae bacterium]|jgi:Fe-S cluster assembly ATP-binding protein|nr:ATP-binding cassette domain-containing protein [Mycoplasmataceae bacterium]